VACEEQPGARAKRSLAGHGANHAHDLGTFDVDGRGEQLGNARIAVRPRRMRARTGILGELSTTQRAHVLDPLDRRRTAAGAEALVAEHGEAFLERHLEPVAAGHPVARPVVQVLVRDQRRRDVELGVGRGLRIRQHLRRVVDREALVLHRPEAEARERDDIVRREIVFAPIFALVPQHRRPERFERVSGAGKVALAHPRS
jgi:hypothetical protein